MDGIRYWIETEGTGHWFFLAFPVILICLFIWFKGRRVRFLIPSLIISLVIINPIFYKYWDELGLYAYWRILWVVPVIPVVAGIVPSITERIEKTWIKAVAAAAGAVLIILGGTFLYNGVGGSFVEAANAAKLPDYVVQIADRLLELDDHPRVIAQDPIGVYIRQYTGKINTLFGRDIHGYITYKPSEEARLITKYLDTGNYKSVSDYMLDYGFNFIITPSSLNDCFEMITNIGEYGIFTAKGKPSQIIERNELGQVITVTIVDDNGNPTDFPRGYSTVCREYDANNNIILQYAVDKAGAPYLFSSGNIGIRQQWERDKLVSREYIGNNFESIQRIDGYSKVEYRETEAGVAYICFYDEEGNRVDEEGINYINGYEYGFDEWSEWMTPEPGEPLALFTTDTFYLGEKAQGDTYTCQLEVEFSNVQCVEGETLIFKTQGRTDSSWEVGNPWWHVAFLNFPPEDGVYQFKKTIVLDEEMAKASSFEFGFRCDNWKSGSFRIRNVKIEKGDTATEWSPGI